MQHSGIKNIVLVGFPAPLVDVGSTNGLSGCVVDDTEDFTDLSVGYIDWFIAVVTIPFKILHNATFLCGLSVNNLRP